MRTGVRLGVDVGSVRIGVARSDPAGALAVPVTTVSRGAGDLDALIALAREWDALEFVVGLPLSLDGSEGPAAAVARRFAEELTMARGAIPVRLVDERLTTAEAHRRMSSAGGRVARERGRRLLVDQAAAVILLEHALDTERGTGHPPGEVVASAVDESTREEGA